MDNPEVVHVYGDDWCGLYVNGKLTKQGHSLTIYDLAAALSITITQKIADEVWLSEEAHLPERLEDVKEAAT